MTAALLAGIFVQITWKAVGCAVLGAALAGLLIFILELVVRVFILTPPKLDKELKGKLDVKELEVSGLHKENGRIESELNHLREQAAPLQVRASVTFPVVGKDNMVWKDKLVISISNQNPRREVKGVVVRLLGISPPLKMRQIYGFCTTDDCGLGGIKLPFSDIPGDVLNGGVTGHIPIFEAERTAIITIVKFCGVWASAHANHFIPSPNEKYVLTVEATAAGLERKESRFEISFSLTPTHPIVAATEIVDAPSHAPLLESSQRKIPCGI